MKNKYLLLIKNGIVDENPVFVQLLALCPLLAVTTSAINGIAMGLSTTAVLISACMVISLFRKLIPPEVRIASFVVIVAGFVTILQMLMNAYFPPAINEALGIYIPLIVVNCVVFARIEIYASKNRVFPSAIDALGMGLGFTLGLFLVGLIREFIGTGSMFGVELNRYQPSHVGIMVLAPGAFFTLGGIIMTINYFKMKNPGAKK